MKMLLYKIVLWVVVAKTAYFTVEAKPQISYRSGVDQQESSPNNSARPKRFTPLLGNILGAVGETIVGVGTGLLGAKAGVQQGLIAGRLMNNPSYELIPGYFIPPSSNNYAMPYNANGPEIANGYYRPNYGNSYHGPGTPNVYYGPGNANSYYGPGNQNGYFGPGNPNGYYGPSNQNGYYGPGFGPNGSNGPNYPNGHYGPGMNVNNWPGNGFVNSAPNGGTEGSGGGCSTSQGIPC